MGFDLAKPYQFESDRELIKFLADHNIQAILSSEAHSSCLHWWEDEKLERLFDVALLQGELFLVVTNKSLELYVLDPNNCWFDLVKVWGGHFSKETFATELKRLMSGNGKDLWLYVQKTVVDRDLKRMLNEIGIEQISADLKKQLLEFHEGLVYFPLKRNEFKQATTDLLTLLARDNVRTPDNCLFIQRYFLNLTIVIENLPQKFRVVVHQIEQSFENGQIPNREMIDSLIKKVEVL